MTNLFINSRTLSIAFVMGAILMVGVLAPIYSAQAQVPATVSAEEQAEREQILTLLRQLITQLATGGSESSLPSLADPAAVAAPPVPTTSVDESILPSAVSGRNFYQNNYFNLQHPADCSVSTQSATDGGDQQQGFTDLIVVDVCESLRGAAGSIRVNRIPVEHLLEQEKQVADSGAVLASVSPVQVGAYPAEKLTFQSSDGAAGRFVTIFATNGLSFILEGRTTADTASAWDVEEIFSTIAVTASYSDQELGFGVPVYLKPGDEEPIYFKPGYDEPTYFEPGEHDGNPNITFRPAHFTGISSGDNPTVRGVAFGIDEISVSLLREDVSVYNSGAISVDGGGAWQHTITQDLASGPYTVVVYVAGELVDNQQVFIGEPVSPTIPDGLLRELDIEIDKQVE